MASTNPQHGVTVPFEPDRFKTSFESREKRAFVRYSTSSDSFVAPADDPFEADLEGEEPTDEDLRTLRRVSGKIPWSAYTICFVELCERFGYYGCQVLCMFNAQSSPRLELIVNCRHKLCPASTSLWATHRQRPRSRGSARCPGHGPTCLHRNRKM